MGDSVTDPLSPAVERALAELLRAVYLDGFDRNERPTPGHDKLKQALISAILADRDAYAAAAVRAERERILREWNAHLDECGWLEELDVNKVTALIQGEGP